MKKFLVKLTDRPELVFRRCQDQISSMPSVAILETNRNFLRHNSNRLTNTPRNLISELKLCQQIDTSIIFVRKVPRPCFTIVERLQCRREIIFNRIKFRDTAIKSLSKSRLPL